MGYAEKTKDQVVQAVAYARVSSKEQEKEGFSIPAQLRLLHDYAAQQGIKIVQEFVDAYALFIKQVPAEKRRLLNFMVSNCIWKDGILTISYKQPFDIIIEYALQARQREGQEGENIAGFEKWLPEQDSNLRPSD